MTASRLDLSGLKCPLPALRTLKALRQLAPGAAIEVHCTDPLAVIDVPNAAREAGATLENQERRDGRSVFLIRKANETPA